MNNQECLIFTLQRDIKYATVKQNNRYVLHFVGSGDKRKNSKMSFDINGVGFEGEGLWV